MKTLCKRKTKSQFTNLKETESLATLEFKKYLKEQLVKTTFNGTEIAAFSWYKKLFDI